MAPFLNVGAHVLLERVIEFSVILSWNVVCYTGPIATIQHW